MTSSPSTAAIAPASIRDARQAWNAARFRPEAAQQGVGHYESWFQRANHPTEPRAFWIRYTIFAPDEGEALGELWAIWFDATGPSPRIVAVREAHPLGDCTFSPHGLDAQVQLSTLREGALQGQASHDGHTVAWDLTYASAEAPLLMLPEARYASGFPKAKALVGAPLARFDGTLAVDGQQVAIDGWLGSQNHNWGRQHTDDYAWGQVAGFDDAPDAFLECATARVRVGPAPLRVWSPRFTMVNLRVAGETYALNGLWKGATASGRYRFFRWAFDSRQAGVRIRGTIEAPREAFVGLTYGNPPGGTKTCLNSKIASCTLTLTRPDHPPLELRTQNRAAFEILTDRTNHGVPILT